MTPAARLAAAIEVLTAVLDAVRVQGPAADTLLARYFRDRRYAGSKDRAAIRDTVYAVLRDCAWDAADARAALVAHLRAHDPDRLALFGADRYAPPALADDEGMTTGPWLPEWLEAAFIERFGDGWPVEQAALRDRAPLDLRVNTLKGSRAAAQAALAAEGIATEPLALSPWGLRAAGGAAVEKSRAFAAGLVEIQDLASQLLLQVADALPGETVIDYCAGAGGKTLGLAASMADRGRLVACDIDAARLARLAPRAARAGAGIIETRCLRDDPLADLADVADLVVVDAPCSGTGTWRRNPEARLRLTGSALAGITALQAEILDRAARLVRPGGRLVYAVCSLLPAEGEAQVRAFGDRAAGFRLADARGRLSGAAAGIDTVSPMSQCLALSPARQGCDGFFVAEFERLC